MPTTFPAIYLGQLTLWDDGDPTDNTFDPANVAASLGTYGGISDPLYINSIVEWAPAGNGTSAVGSDTIFNTASLDDGNGGYIHDQFSIDGGAPRDYAGHMVFNATITYQDINGNLQTAVITASVAQDTDGHTYWIPENSDNADHAAMQAGRIISVEFTGISWGSGTVGQAYSTMADRQAPDFVMCFASGAMIRTDEGEKPIDVLKAGDRVETADGQSQPIQWIGSTRISKDQLMQNPKLRPVRIAAGALGCGLPERDLLVSRQHRVFVRSKIARRMFGTEEVLIPAIKLIGLDGVEIDYIVETVEYFHMLFDKHEIIHSNGALTESLFTGPEALKAVSPKARVEIETLFPELRQPGFIGQPARQIPESGHKIKQLVARHVKNGMSLYRAA